MDGCGGCDDLMRRDGVKGRDDVRGHDDMEQDAMFCLSPILLEDAVDISSPSASCGPQTWDSSESLLVTPGSSRCMFTRVHVCGWVYARARVCACVCVCTRVCERVCKSVIYIYIYIYICICIYVCVCVRMCVCVCVCVCVYTHIIKRSSGSKKARVIQQKSEGEGERESKRTEENHGVAAFEGSQKWQVSPAKRTYENRVRLQRKPDNFL